MKSKMNSNVWVGVFLVVVWLGGTVASAQTNAEINAEIQFNFTTPGARSLAMGGAFIGLADDATAAFTNPAGLTVLSKPEISIEGRRTTYTTKFTDRGHNLSPATGDGVDDTTGLISGESEEDISNLSFFSFVYPRGRWAVALYRHELANFEADIETQGPFFGEEPFRFFPVRASLDIKIVNLGASLAYKLSDSFSMGIGASYYDFELTSLTRRYNLIPFGTEPGEFFGPPLFSEDNVVNSQSLSGDEADVAFNIGFLWKLTEKVSLGGAYRQGPEFDFSTSSEAGPVQNNPGQIFATNSGTFKIPDVIGIGLAFRPSDALTITLDYDLIEYSVLTEATLDVFFDDDDESQAAQERRAAVRRLTVDDADEFHLGFEYVFINMRYPIALRFGGWYDPDHRIRYEGTPVTTADRSTATLFRPGDDEFHFSAGIGFVFGEKFQLDAAYDTSELVDTLSLSAVYRF